MDVWKAREIIWRLQVIRLKHLMMCKRRGAVKMCSVGKCVVGNGVPYFRHALLFPCSNAVLVTLLCSPRTPICFEKMDLLLIVLFCDANTGNIFGILGHFVPPSLWHGSHLRMGDILFGLTCGCLWRLKLYSSQKWRIIIWFMIHLLKTMLSWIINTTQDVIYIADKLKCNYKIWTLESYYAILWVFNCISQLLESRTWKFITAGILFCFQNWRSCRNFKFCQLLSSQWWIPGCRAHHSFRSSIHVWCWWPWHDKASPLIIINLSLFLNLVRSYSLCWLLNTQWVHDHEPHRSQVESILRFWF